MAEAFVYYWKDTLTDKYYIGYHKGSQDDGYVCSSRTMMEEYNKRENNFHREVIADYWKKKKGELS